ncbi:MAG: hypothetical protein H0W27_08920 [Actinobacteria bacterium]|nr:hypothetical protein [Actinomycetota bacterium]
MAGRKTFTLARAGLFVLLVSLVAVPALGGSASNVDAKVLSRLSGTVVNRFYMANPDLAPAGSQSRYLAIKNSLSRFQGDGFDAPLGPPFGDRFNADPVGLPQNEESVTVCRGAPNYLMGGTNDYRGLLDPQLNFTGWHYSNDAGTTLTNEGLLPPVTASTGEVLPSGGDPVNGCAIGEGGPNFYAASLNYDPFDPFGQKNAIGAYLTAPDALESCAGGSDPACWPVRRAVAESAPGHFLDKEWMDVGDTGDGIHVWVTYSDFDIFAPCCFAQIKAVRCTADLVNCSAPITMSEGEDDIQFSDVTVGPDGRTYISWAQIFGEIEGTPQTFRIKMRVGAPGCQSLACFGPKRFVNDVTLAIPFGGRLQANDFRIATYPKNEVKIVNGKPRVFVVWDECDARIMDGTLCEFPKIKLKYSDDFGKTWSSLKVLSTGGVNYFPSIANDVTNGEIAVAYFTTRYDTQYHSGQDIEMVTLNATTATVTNRQRVTSDEDMPNFPEADPTLEDFIGDYIEVFAHGGTAWVHYNMNIRDVKFLGEGFPVAQQDNFLTSIGL